MDEQSNCSLIMEFTTLYLSFNDNEPVKDWCDHNGVQYRETIVKLLIRDYSGTGVNSHGGIHWPKCMNITIYKFEIDSDYLLAIQTSIDDDYFRIHNQISTKEIMSETIIKSWN